MTQFLADASHFEEQYQPLNIWKFDNEVEFNPESQHNDYYIKVWYEAKGGLRLLYNFQLNHGEQEGQFTLQKTSFDISRLAEDGEKQ